MKFMIQRRSLIAAAVAVFAPLAVVWLNGATAQESAKKSSNYFRETSQFPGGGAGQPAGYGVPRTVDTRSQADHEREIQMHKLLSDYSHTDEEKQRSKILDELSKVVSEQFDARQEVREKELKDLEEKVRKLRELQQRRAKEKDLIVRDRVRQLLRDVDGLGWGDESRGDELVPIAVPRAPVPGTKRGF